MYYTYGSVRAIPTYRVWLYDDLWTDIYAHHNCAWCEATGRRYAIVHVHTYRRKHGMHGAARLTTSWTSVSVCCLSYSHLWPSMENPAYGIFCENRVWCIFDKLYPRANSPASLWPLTHFAWEIAHFVHDLATCMEIEKLRSEGAMHAAFLYTSVSVYYAWTGNHLNGLGRKWTQRSSSITSDASSMPKKLKRWQ